MTTGRGIIAAGHSETAQAGIEMLEAGGNAFDAALAAMLASFVAEASLTSMGGGGFMNTYTAEGESALFDFFVQTPLKRRHIEEMDFRKTWIHFGTASQSQYSGKGSVAVPGCPAGLFHIHERLGSLPMKKIIRPAVELARKGVMVTAYQGYSLGILEEILLAKPEVAAIFTRNGKAIVAGENMYMPDFADVLEWMEEDGLRVFYEGDIAEKFAQDNAESGGSVSLEDLKAYRVEERQALRRPFRDHEIITNPPPSAGGSLIAFGLSSLNAKPHVRARPKGPKWVQLMIDTFKEMDHFRTERLTPHIQKIGNTTHISVLDSKGNAASLTTTVGGASGEIIPGTAIQTNNMLGELDLFPNGIYRWPENRRVSSMMSPSIVLYQGRPRYVIGSGGSSRIRTAILQVLYHLIDQGMQPQESVDWPRIHWEAGRLSVEPDLLSEAEQKLFAGADTTFWQDKNMYFGGTHLAVLEPNGDLLGAADHRRAGVVMAC